MAKQVPITVKNEKETLELMGRHNNIESLKRHIDIQKQGQPNSKFAIFLYLVEKKES